MTSFRSPFMAGQCILTILQKYGFLIRFNHDMRLIDDGEKLRTDTFKISFDDDGDNGRFCDAARSRFCGIFHTSCAGRYPGGLGEFLQYYISYIKSNDAILEERVFGDKFKFPYA